MVKYLKRTEWSSLTLSYLCNKFNASQIRNTFFLSPASQDVLSSQMSLSKKITHRREEKSFFVVNFGTLLLRVSVRNNLEYTSSSV